MNLFKNYKDSQRYDEATNIVRNKIVGSAANVLTNSRTAFNFDASIKRLDKSYADNRPMYVLEHELITLQQGKSSIEQFYNSVNDKLTTIVNKINMTYSEQSVIEAFCQEMAVAACRTVSLLRFTTININQYHNNRRAVHLFLFIVVLYIERADGADIQISKIIEKKEKRAAINRAEK